MMQWRHIFVVVALLSLLHHAVSQEMCHGVLAHKAGVSQHMATSDASMAAMSALHVQESACNDGVKDGLETGVDCGGNCPGCSVGTACKVATDCSSNVCRNKKCQVRLHFTLCFSTL